MTEPAFNSGTHSLSPAARLEVAVYASHQAALERVRNCLAASEFNLHPSLLESPGAAPAEVEPSQVQIVDVHGSLLLIENVAGELRRRGIAPLFLALDEGFSLDSAFPLIFLGVRGLISYERMAQELARAVKQLAQGVFWIPRTMLSGMVEMLLARVPAAQKPFPLIQISPREGEIVPLLLESRTNKEIAAELHISERTVKYHVANLLRKCRVRRRHELALFLYRNGLLANSAAPADAALPPSAPPGRAR